MYPKGVKKGVICIFLKFSPKIELLITKFEYQPRPDMAFKDQAGL